MSEMLDAHLVDEVNITPSVGQILTTPALSKDVTNNDVVRQATSPVAAAYLAIGATVATAIGAAVYGVEPETIKNIFKIGGVSAAMLSGELSFPAYKEAVKANMEMIKSKTDQVLA